MPSNGSVHRARNHLVWPLGIELGSSSGSAGCPALGIEWTTALEPRRLSSSPGQAGRPRQPGPPRRGWIANFASNSKRRSTCARFVCSGRFGSRRRRPRRRKQPGQLRSGRRTRPCQPDRGQQGPLQTGAKLIHTATQLDNRSLTGSVGVHPVHTCAAFHRSRCCHHRQHPHHRGAAGCKRQSYSPTEQQEVRS